MGGPRTRAQAQAEAPPPAAAVSMPSILDEDDSPLSELESEPEQTIAAPRPGRLFTVLKNDVKMWTGTFDSAGFKEYDTYPRPIKVLLPDHPPIILPSLNISLVKDALGTVDKPSDLILLEWIKSNDVLPIIRMWHDAVYAEPTNFQLMQHTFGPWEYPWRHSRQQVLGLLSSEKLVAAPPQHFAVTAKHANTIINNNQDWFESNLDGYDFSDDQKHNLAVSVLLTTWHDLQTRGAEGFFGILLKSTIALPKADMARKVLDMWYIIDESRIGEHEHLEESSGPLTAHGFMAAMSKEFVRKEKQVLEAKLLRLEERINAQAEIIRAKDKQQAEAEAEAAARAIMVLHEMEQLKTRLLQHEEEYLPLQPRLDEQGNMREVAEQGRSADVSNADLQDVYRVSHTLGQTSSGEHRADRT